MSDQDNEDKLLHPAAIENAGSVLLARKREDRESLEQKTDELAHSLAMMRATLESTADGILVTDEHKRTTGFNEKYIEMWGVSREIMTSADSAKLLQAICRRVENPAQFIARIEDIYVSSTPESFDIIELVDGSVFERFSKIQLVDGRNVGRVWSLRDITERKRLLERERAARTEAERASKMKDEFLATLSHELRTPLSAILGWSQVLQRQTSADQVDFQQGLQAIERNARMQAQLIEDLLDMSRIASGKVRLDIQPLEPAPFIEAAIETVRPAADAKGIRLEKSLDLSAGPISGDPNRLQQIVWNLLSNAIKFTPKGGRVEILLRRVNSHVEINVTDTGVGIKTEFLPYVFERFRQADSSTTRKFGGLGLGLSIVKNLVELHGGGVQVKSQGEGFGTTFSIHLPIAAVYRADDEVARHRPQAPYGNSKDFKHSDLSGIKILVVDDELDALHLVKRVLTECDAQVLTADTASDALALVEKERPQVLISDIGMPDVDGYELLRRVRALGEGKGGKIPAIALTAFARLEDRTHALRVGFLVHISKPVEPSELVATVASVVGRAGESDSQHPA